MVFLSFRREQWAVAPGRSLFPYRRSPIAGRARIYACRIEPSLYVFASSIAPAIEDAKIFPQKPQQIPLSSPSTRQNHLNQQKTKEKNLSSKWHTSYVQRHTIKAVGNKETRPISRAFAFNAPSQTVVNQRITRKYNRMTTLQIQPAKPPISVPNPNV